MKRKIQFINNNDDDKEYRENIIYELDMPNEKRINGKNYIGDLKRRKRFFRDKSFDHPDNIRLRLSILEAQVEKLYNALEFSNVIKATPIVSLVYSNDTKKCHDYVSIIYNKWITYLSVGCKINDGIRLSNIFHNLDYYIFNGFFEKYMKYNNLQLEIIDDPTCMVDDESRQRNREFVSIKMEGGNKIVTRFASKVLQSVCSSENKENFFNSNDNDSNNNNNQNDIQLDNNKLHSHLSKNKSLIDQLDNRGIFVNFSSNNSRLINQDRRFVILGSERPLFNTTVFTSDLNNLNNALHNMGASLLNYSLVIFHSMLHLKCFIETGNYSFDHNVTFIQELINFTPSVLFGHFLLPPVSISV